MYVRAGSVCGYVLVESVARHLVVRAVEAVGEEQLVMGVRRIWVGEQCRRTGVAKAILDCARQSFAYGQVVEKHMVAFTAPTEAGSRFAHAYTAAPELIVYHIK